MGGRERRAGAVRGAVVAAIAVAVLLVFAFGGGLVVFVVVLVVQRRYLVAEGFFEGGVEGWEGEGRQRRPWRDAGAGRNLGQDRQLTSTGLGRWLPGCSWSRAGRAGQLGRARGPGSCFVFLRGSVGACVREGARTRGARRAAANACPATSPVLHAPPQPPTSSRADPCPAPPRGAGGRPRRPPPSCACAGGRLAGAAARLWELSRRRRWRRRRSERKKGRAVVVVCPR